MGDPIELPDLPTDIEFEDLIAAQLQLSGYHLERNIIEREQTDVLELDIVKTDYKSDIPEFELIEVKSGKWGFTDIFKLRGWMTYLEYYSGSLIVKKEREPFDFISEKAKSLGINIRQTEGDAKTPELLEIDDYSNDELDHWRYAYWIERELIKLIKDRKKENREMKCYQVASDYYQHLCGGIYFYDTVAEKLDNLYKWHNEHPNLSASTSNEIKNGDFSDQNGIISSLFKSTFYDCEINEIQSTTLIEYLAKLQVLKNAVDYSLYLEHEKVELADKVDFKLADWEFKKSDSLPISFSEGVEYLRLSGEYKFYPILWSYFIYVFGGFILKKYKDEEYAYLEKRSGVSKDNIDHALNAFDIFFPIEKGWFYENNYIKFLKMFPTPLRGVASHFKKELYLEGEEGFSDLGSGDYGTISNLVKWNNCGYYLLKGEF